MRKRVFLKQLTPAEVGDTKTHEKYIRLPNNFDYKSFFQDGGTTNGSVIQIDFVASYTGNLNEQIPLKFVYYANSNEEKRIPSLGQIFDRYNITSQHCACLESITKNGSTSFSISFKKEPEIRLFSSPIIYEIEESDQPNSFNNLEDITKTPSLPLQQIFYGAPGTGKSYTIKKTTEDVDSKFVIRTTFHPDSDYSTFVGAYKPKMEVLPRYNQEIGEQIGVEKRIVYAYTPQAFLKAYTTAWNNPEQNVYLIIEEINRGNCAQIFGDLFQLLDRGDDDKSCYPIKADQDMQMHLMEAFADNASLPENIQSGEELILPSNLYIWATMNTSDQSLFPIDSAFKRRWEWKYIKIADGKENWKVNVDGKNYDWWKFVKIINGHINDATQSEDKCLGYYFAKAKDGIISADTFVSKVIFYLYTDVFKDYGFSADIFRGENGGEMTFQSFYNEDGSANEAQIARFIENVIGSDE